MAILDPVLNPIIEPMLAYGTFWAIAFLALLISILVTLAYKFFTNQDEMKRLKERQKEFQQKMRGLRDNPTEMMKVQKEAMSVNMEYMKHSFKVMLITMLPVLLIFGWMNAHLQYEPVMPGEEFVVVASFAKGVTGKVVLEVDKGEVVGDASKTIDDEVYWRVKSSEGERTLRVIVGDDTEEKKVLVTKELEYLEPVSKYKSKIKTIEVEHNPVKPVNELVGGELSIFGWQPGWLGLYIIFSLIFSIVLRKVFKVY